MYLFCLSNAVAEIFSVIPILIGHHILPPHMEAEYDDRVFCKEEEEGREYEDEER